MPFAVRPLIVFTLYSSAVVVAFQYLGWTFIGLPFLPIVLVGTAVAFSVGFKNDSSYDRLWEGRKIWGGIANVSRVWGVTTKAYVTTFSEGQTF